jgi:hypothetical protein
MAYGIRADDGTLRVTVVDGTTNVGLHAPDGSINVIESNGTYLGLYHPCGALQVTVVDGSAFVGFYAIDGSMNVIESVSRASGATPVTAVSGTLAVGSALLLEDGLRYILLESGDNILLQ